MMIHAKQEWPQELAERYRQLGYWTGETFGEFLRKRTTESPDAIAVVQGDKRWTYAELDSRADALARGFPTFSLRAGDRVVVHLPNIAEFVGIIFGMYRAGIVPVFALPAHRITEIKHFAEAAEAKAYVIADSFGGFNYRELAAELTSAVPAIEHVFVVGDAGEFTSIDEVAARGAGKVLPSSPSPSDVAFFQLSGGSTGLSKLIPRTHDDYLYSVRRSSEICLLDANTVYLGTLPIAHNFPMSSPGFLGALYAGGRVVLSPSPDANTAFKLVEQERVTITGVVPPIALMWIEAARSTSFDISSLQVLQVGGAKLSPEAARQVTPAMGCQLQQVFGMAEGLVNYTRLDDSEDVIINTQGRPMCPDDEVLIVDDNDIPVVAGESGFLLTRGPYTIRGYHNAKAANSNAFTLDGFYRTGDVVRLTAEGNFVVEGRATDRINRGGEKISADEVEDHLLAHPQVHDAVVIGVADEYLGEKTCAYIVPRGETPRATTIRAWIRSRGVAAFKIPDQIVFVEAFPTTGVGKISRKQLRAALREQLAATSVKS